MDREMNMIWRFYVDERHLWRWQQLSVNRAVIAESPGAFDAYVACLENAAEQGYVFVAAKTKPLPANAKLAKGRR
jgi:hypothetical protein